MNYDEKHFKEIKIKNVEDCLKYKKNKKTVTWINVDGLKDAKTLEKLCNFFDLHPLVIEDILQTSQRPKIEDYGDYLYIVIRVLLLEKQKIGSEQTSIVLGKNYVISFNENEDSIFNNVRERLRNDKGKVRRKGADFLAYTLLDAIVDNYFVILEEFGERIELMESALLKHPDQKTLYGIRKLKKELITLRKSVWPVREILTGLERESRSKDPLITKKTGVYLRDVYDHTIQVMDNIESFRDMVAGMFDIYLSSVSIRLNEVMKVLTIIGTIFIPLTFITGWYGMNFKDMPELSHPLGYPVVLAVMGLIAIVMLFFFRRKRWI